MLIVKIVSIFFFLCAVTDSKKTCRQKLQGPIIPRYANDVKETLSLKITYKHKHEVNCGNYLGFLVTVPRPTVKFDVKGQCVNTTVLFIGIPTRFYDTDAIVGYPYLHWLVHNVPAGILKEGFKGQAGDVKTDYLPPINPFSDHYYTFFVYCQEKYIDVHKKSDLLLLDRPSFPVKEYAKAHQLGDPLAINYLVSTFIENSSE